MARFTFFSFHYERDIWRANVVRNSWVTQDRAACGFFDASLWEESKAKGDGAIKQIIDDGLRGTSVTVVLIGRDTSTREYVRYEIERSVERGNGLLGIHIYNIEDQLGNTDTAGRDPLPAGYRTYYWYGDDGFRNIGKWVEDAARAAGR